jgi:hypothetical protein
MKKKKPLRPVIEEAPLAPRETFCVSCSCKLIVLSEKVISLYGDKGTYRELGCPNGCKVVTGFEPTKGE